MINNVTLVGRTTRDIDMRYSGNGTAIANFSLAVNRPFKNANGEQETDFINIVQFGKGAELTAQYVKKGNQIGLTGRIQTRNYENKEGQRVYVTEVVADRVAFLEPKSQNNQQPQSKPQEKPQASDPFKGQAEAIDIDDDSLPF
jgi:single-strand DNA-binding protein